MSANWSAPGGTIVVTGGSRPSPCVGKVPRSQVEQVSEFPEQITLMVPDLAIGQHNTPHHLCQHQSLTQVEAIADDSRELEVIDGPVPLGFGQNEQFMDRGGLEAEVAAHGRFDVAPLPGRKLAVRLGQLDQERAGGELGIIMARGGGGRSGWTAAALLNELPEGFEHSER